MKSGFRMLSGFINNAKEVITPRGRRAAAARSAQPGPETFTSSALVNQTKEEDATMPNIKTITVTFHVNEDTGNIVNATQYDGSPGKSGVPQGEITDCQALVVSRNSPSCIWIKIGGQCNCL
jgi:hypothetical protein